ncbi:MAG: ribonuclease HII [Minisyncoccia bacterium]|jgi:ribonuclease HII
MRWTIGIDEVGRGALAGPVVVAAAALPRGFAPRSRALGALKDSKKLNARKREAWLLHFNDLNDREGQNAARIMFAIARVYPRQIEKRNISKTANMAAERAFSRLCAAGGGVSGRGARAGGKKRAGFTYAKCRIFLDGGLFLGNGSQPKNARTIIKGDEKIAAIKAASIIAKVRRDRLMCRLAKKYPHYGFEIHKGYGTEAHRRAIRKHGPCPAHRLTFMGKSAIMRK